MPPKFTLCIYYGVSTYFQSLKLIVKYKKKNQEAKKKNNKTEKYRKAKENENCGSKNIADHPELIQIYPGLSLMTAVRWNLTEPGIIAVISLNRSSGGNFPDVL